MRIVYVVDRFPALSETWIAGELRELVRRGDDVLVVARVPGDSAAAAPDLAARTVHPPARLSMLARATLRALLANPRRALPAFAWSVRARRRERGALRAFGQAAALAPRVGDADHLHAHFAHGSASLALLLARLTRRPFSFTGHAYDVLVATQPRLLRRKIAEASFTVAVSEWSRERLAALARPHDRDKVVLVRNGVDLRALARQAEARSGPPAVLTVARLVDKKGVDLAVDACAELSARGVDHRWLVVGDGPLRGRLEAQARRLGVERTITFAGAQGQDAVAERLRAATVFALPCRVAGDGDQDILPVAIVEAQAAGVAVVSTPVGGIPEVARSGGAAVLVPCDDARALADAVQAVLTDDRRRAKLARGGRQVAQEYDVRASVARLRELFAAEPA